MWTKNSIEVIKKDDSLNKIKKDELKVREMTAGAVVEIKLAKSTPSFLDVSQKKTYKKKKGKFLFKSISLIAAFTTVCCLIFMGYGNNFFSKLGMFSVGFSSPDGGAKVLSEWLEREPATYQGDENTVGKLKEDEIDNEDFAGGEGQNVDVPLKSVVAPKKAGDGGTVAELQFSSGSDFLNGIAIKNNTSKKIDVAKESKIKPNFKIVDSDKPQVLIMHTHTTEAYMEYFAGYFNASDFSRTLDNSKNVVMVGEIIASQLEAQGIKVIHDKTVNDNPQYTGAYTRSGDAVKKILKDNPSIKVVLDVHRDATNKSPTEKLKPTATIGGKKAAQVMIVNGIANTDSQPHPNWIENIRMSFQLQSALHTKYPGLVRPVYIVNSRYNQQLSNGSILLEMGSEANTLEEVAYSGQLVGKTLAEVLLTMK